MLPIERIERLLSKLAQIRRSENHAHAPRLYCPPPASSPHNRRLGVRMKSLTYEDRWYEPAFAGRCQVDNHDSRSVPSLHSARKLPVRQWKIGTPPNPRLIQGPVSKRNTSLSKSASFPTGRLPVTPSAEFFSQSPQPLTAFNFRLQPPHLLSLLYEHPQTNRCQPPQRPTFLRPALRPR